MYKNNTRLCSLTENVTDTKICNLDDDITIHSLLWFSPAEDVSGLQIIVEDGRTLSVKECQSTGELPDQPPDTKLWMRLDWIGRQVIPQSSSVAELHHDGQLPHGVLELVEVGHDELMLEPDEDRRLLLGHFLISDAAESLHGHLVSLLAVGFPLLQGAEIHTGEGSRPDSLDLLEVSVLRVLADGPLHLQVNTAVYLVSSTDVLATEFDSRR